MVDPLVAAATRAIHVLAMAALVGGPWAAWLILRQAGKAGLSLRSLVRLERWSWLAAGIVVLTGIGNVGNLEAGYPAMGSARGLAFATKFTLAALFLLLSMARTVAVSRLLAREEDAGRVAWRNVASWYGATALMGGGIAGLGLLLAHGGIRG